MPNANEPCPICGESAETFDRNLDWVEYRCGLCGMFKYDRHCKKPATSRERALVRGWVCEQNRVDERPHITSALITRVLSLRMPSVPERADRLLLHVIRNQQNIGALFTRNDPGFVAATYSIDQAEVGYLFNLLSVSGMIQVDGSFANGSLTMAGHRHAAQIGSAGAASAQGFVAMWFDPGLREAWDNGFSEGIRRAGYQPIRVDGVEHVGKIDDEIISQIRKSRFVVADFTGHRGGVYFEAGFALGLSLPIVWTCRRDHIAGLHFDIRQFNCIDWTKPAELAERLKRRIEAAIGAGPLAPG